MESEDIDRGGQMVLGTSLTYLTIFTMGNDFCGCIVVSKISVAAASYQQYLATIQFKMYVLF